MSFHIYHRYGNCDSNPSLDSLDSLYDELVEIDNEHPNVSVEHESGWNLGAYSSGLLIWENVEEDESPKHMRDVPREEVLRLWKLLAIGELDEIHAESWSDGYG